jgi:hypothetical protein
MLLKSSTAEVLLQCLDAMGTEKNFLIFKDRNIVLFSSASGKVWGEYLETPSKYLFKFPKAETRSAAMVKINRNNGMMEFETGKLPHLSILWTANCTEHSR